MLVRGPSLALRYPRADDAPELFRLARDPEVVRHFSWGPYRDESEPRAWIETLPARRERGERLELAIVDAGDRPLGITGLSEHSPRDRRAVVGTWLGREHWGTGANAASKELILALAFRTLALNRVSAYASPGNPRSLRALARLGFVHEGVLAEWHRHGGRHRDVAILRLLRAEWERTPLAAAPVRVEGEPPPAWVTPT